MGWSYGEKPARLRQRDLSAAAHNAEWAVPEGRIGALIRMQRHRAAGANTRTNLVLAALIATILAGIVFFVGAPLWKRLADGQRQTLTAQLATIRTESDKLDKTRDTVRAALASLLEDSPQVIESGVSADLNGGIADGRTILLFGDYGAITRSTNGGASFSKVSSGVEGDLDASIVDGQTILLFGEGGAITRSTDGGASFTAVPSDVEGHLRNGIVDGQTILLFGDGGAITRSTDGGASLIAMPSGVQGDLYDSIVDGQTILLFGTGGTITRSIDHGASFTAVPSGVEGDLSDSIVDGQTILLFGPDGAITRSTDGGANFTKVPSGVEGELESAIVDGQTILMFGGGYNELSWGGLLPAYGAITRSTDGGASFTAVPSDVEGYLRDGIVDGQTVLLFGDAGAITRSTDGGANFVAVPSGVRGNLHDSIVDEQTILLFGTDGAITRSTDGGESFTAVASGVYGVVKGGNVDAHNIQLFSDNAPSPGGATLIIMAIVATVEDGEGYSTQNYGFALTKSTDGGASFTAMPTGADSNIEHMIIDGQTTLLFGGNGSIVRISDELSDQVRKLELPAGEAGDAALLGFIDRDLPDHLRNWTVLREEPRNKLLDVQSRRAALVALEAETNADLDRIDKVAFGLLQRDRQREEFAAFMDACRGGAAGAPGEGAKPEGLTLACLQGWQAQVASDDGTWWQTLANQVPPGILILFLLATLSGLYRYNMRMAGFHHSRADALELLAQNLPKEQIDQLVGMADALAADKVEFGKENSPTDQAVDMFKAVVSRTSK